MHSEDKKKIRKEKPIKIDKRFEDVDDNEGAKKEAKKTDPKKENSSKKPILYVKDFKERPSYLTKLMDEVNHVESVYHIFVVCLVLMLLYSCCHDLLLYGSIKLGIDTIKQGLGEIHYTLALLFGEHLILFALFFGWKLWACVWLKICNNTYLSFSWSLICLCSYLGVLFGMVALITLIRLRIQLPLITGFVLLIETTRLLMKIHGFIRTNCGLLLALKPNFKQRAEFKLPKFTSFLYFLFAPTLLYRESYPRSKTRSWSFAAARLVEILGVTYLFCCVYEHHIKVHFHDFGLYKVTWIEFADKIYGMLLPCSFIFLGIFYAVLHAVQNLAAELLRFGDRQFYTDWWNASSYDVYFRRWNMLVQEWLYEYIYKDFYVHIFKRSKVLSSLTVFIISGLVHEFILSYTLRYCFPVMFVLFLTLGVPQAFVARGLPRVFGNIFLWFSLMIGNTVMISLYCMEYNARRNFNETFSSWQDFLQPVTWRCLERDEGKYN